MLADTRTELLTATPITIKPAKDEFKTTRQLEYAELLNYAQRIARFTVPPADQRIPKFSATNGAVNDEAGVAVAVPGIKIEVQSPAPLSEQQPTQQTTTPVQTPAPGPLTPASQPINASHLTLSGDSRAIEALPEEIRRWLDPASSRPQYTPWPGEDMIRRGALARIQGMVENGQNPETVDEVNGVADKTASEGQTRAHDDEVRERARERRMPATGPPASRPRQDSRDEGLLGFDLYNPDED